MVFYSKRTNRAEASKVYKSRIRGLSYKVTLLLICLAVISIVIMAGCVVYPSGPAQPDSEEILLTETEDETDMSISKKLPEEVPPLDKQIPESLETATFALG